MLFNSYVFIFLFLPVTFGLYFLINRTKQYSVANFVLIAASLVFYAYYNIAYLAILATSILVNFAFHKLLKASPKKVYLCLALVVNIGILAYFKYFNFILENINLIANQSFSALDIILPLGISFFTFQQISYLVDTYKGEVPNYSFLDYVLYIAFFPKLVMGPLVSHDEIIPQFKNVENRKINPDNLARGLQAFSIGLAKKVLVADNFGKIVNYGFSDLANLNTLEALLVILGYTMQIYFDFSGYCDMAVGIGLMFNIRLPQNFNSPYKATDINDFWKRWHITLTKFLTKYIYSLGWKPQGENQNIPQYFNCVFHQRLVARSGIHLYSLGNASRRGTMLDKVVEKAHRKSPEGHYVVYHFRFSEYHMGLF